MSGGMALTQAAAERWAEVTGCNVYEGYGLTETSPTATTNPGNGRQLGTIGIPVPQTYVKTVVTQVKPWALARPESCALRVLR